MKNLILYRILSYILLILAGLLSIFVLFGLLTALSNPVILLPLFLMACVVIYSYTSWRFLTRGIDYNQPCKTSLRDLIRVNAMVSILFAFLLLLQSYTILTNPKLLETTLEQATAMQGSGTEEMKQLMPKIFMSILKFMIVYSILLLVHNFFTFRLLKQYRHIFEPPKDGSAS